MSNQLHNNYLRRKGIPGGKTTLTVHIKYVRRLCNYFSSHHEHLHALILLLQINLVSLEYFLICFFFLQTTKQNSLASNLF